MTAQRVGRPPREGGGSSIYDLGYQGYEGPRLGRRAAIGALLTHSLRTAYGLGRNARSKALPVGLVLFSIVPPLIFIGVLVLFARFGVGAQAREAVLELAPIRYSTLFPFTAVLVFLFSAAQAPELFGRDQLVGALPLYFSRAIKRSDYAIARLMGLFISLLVVVFAPQVILFTGRVLVAPDLVEGFGAELPEMPVTIVVGLLVAAVVGSLSAAIASLTPRRSYATVAIVATFLIANGFASLLVALEVGLVAQMAVLLSPSDVLDGVNAVLFGVPADSDTVRLADLDDWVYLAAAAAWMTGSLVVLLARYRRITA